jgi:integrase/recombinase XerC
MNEISVIGNDGITESTAITEEFYNRWLAFIDVRPKSVDTYRKAVKQFLVYLSENGISQPVKEDVINWREYLKETHKATTVQTYLTAVKLFFSWLEDEGLYKNIAYKVKPPKIEVGYKKDYLTSKQSHKILSNIDTSTVKGIRDYAIVALMITTGVRTIEIERADVGNIRTVADNTVLFIQGKGKDEKSDYVKIAPQVEDAIIAYLKARGEVREDEPLFTSTSNNNAGKRMTTRSIRTIAKNSMVEAGYNSERYTAHSMRHTAGTLALLNGSSLAQVQQLLRHSNINTTMIYQHGIERAENNSEINVANAIF